MLPDETMPLGLSNPVAAAAAVGDMIAQKAAAAATAPFPAAAAAALPPSAPVFHPALPDPVTGMLSSTKIVRFGQMPYAE